VRARFRTAGVAGLDRPKAGRKDHAVSDACVERVVQLAMSPPPAGRGRWTTRLLAKEVGLTAGCVSDVLRRNGFKPHSGAHVQGQPRSTIRGEGEGFSRALPKSARACSHEQFYKSMTSDANGAIWQDVYHSEADARTSFYLSLSESYRRTLSNGECRRVVPTTSSGKLQAATSPRRDRSRARGRRGGRWRLCPRP
jgi:hypothetical protein